MRGGKKTKKGLCALKIGDERSLSPPSSDSEDSDYGPSREENSKSRKSTKRCKKKSKTDGDEALFFLTKSQSKDETRLEQDYGVNLWLILKEVEANNHQERLPAEILIKIIKYSIEFSDNPLFQLVNCSQVSEYWRQIVIFSSDLWSRIDLTHLPQTSRNIKTLKDLLKSNTNIAHNVRRLDIEGWNIDKSCIPFLDTIIEHRKLEHLGLKTIRTVNRTLLFDTISKACESLKSLVITNSKHLLHSNQSWIAHQLSNHGSKLETLDLNLSLHSISSNLFKTICSPCCLNLKVLDLSTGVYINQGSAGIDATLLASNLPNLEILRCATTSFKRVINPARVYGLPKLKELSIPTSVPDQDRDDALFGTLAYGSLDLEYLDLRGSVISTYALIGLPSTNITALHIDVMVSNIVRNYRLIIEKWATSLECLSLLRVNDQDAINDCMKIIANKQKEKPTLRAIDLSGSDVNLTALERMLSVCTSLEAINLTSCRSLPRGFKGSYSSNVRSNRLSITTLRSRVANFLGYSQNSKDQ